MIPNQVIELCKKFDTKAPKVHIENIHEQEENQKNKPLSRLAVESLNPEKWEGDVIIDDYLKLMQQETESNIVQLTMHWYEKLEKSRNETNHEYPKNITLMIPIKTGKNWILVKKMEIH